MFNFKFSVRILIKCEVRIKAFTETCKDSENLPATHNFLVSYLSMHSCKGGTKGKPWDSINSVSKSKDSQGKCCHRQILRTTKQPSNQSANQLRKKARGWMHAFGREISREREIMLLEPGLKDYFKVLARRQLKKVITLEKI